MTPILAGLAAWLGGRPATKAAREAQRWETVRSASDRVHAGNVPDAKLAYNQLSDLVRRKKLTTEQVDWAEAAIRSYTENKP